MRQTIIFHEWTFFVTSHPIRYHCYLQHRLSNRNHNRNQNIENVLFFSLFILSTIDSRWCWFPFFTLIEINCWTIGQPRICFQQLSQWTVQRSRRCNDFINVTGFLLIRTHRVIRSHGEIWTTQKDVERHFCDHSIIWMCFDQLFSGWNLSEIRVDFNKLNFIHVE